MSTKKQEGKLENRERLRKIRAGLGLTQGEVAKCLGITSHAYCKKEKGHLSISVEEAYLISKKLNFSIEELFFGK